MAEHQDADELRHRLWREIDKVKIGMLGLAGGPPRHMQPMTAYIDEDENAIWFLTKSDTDLCREAGEGHTAMFCVIAKDQEFHACVQGQLALHNDRAKIDQVWTPVAAAWFPEGKDDPKLALLRFSPEDAELWVSHRGPVRFAYEIAKANATRTEPDVGGAAHIQMQT